MKIYEVIFQDEWNNLTLLGHYRNLNDATKDINDVLSIYGVAIKDGDIKEYPSTFDMVFDTSISEILGDMVSEEVSDSISGLMIRGFILDSDKLERSINDKS